MKFSIRVRLLGWLLLFMIFTSMLSFLADQVHHLLEARGVIPKAFGLTGELSVFIVANITLFPLVAFTGWRITKRMLAPVRAISDTAASIVEGQLGARIETDVADDDLGRLSQIINRAFDAYEASLTRLQRFSADASHQLRTPLTTLRMKGEICLNRSRTPDEYRDTIEVMLEQLARLSRIVEQLLDLSRLEAPSLQKRFSEVDICAIAWRTVHDFEPLCSDKHVLLDGPDGPSAPVRGDEALLEQVFANLLDNAIRFTPAGGTIRIEVRREGGEVLINVSDSGTGIPVSYASAVLERFNKGAHPQGGGAGLGLAIVAEIVRVHCGHIDIRPGIDVGTTVCVSFPAAASTVAYQRDRHFLTDS